MPPTEDEYVLIHSGSRAGESMRGAGYLAETTSVPAAKSPSR